MSIDVKVAVQRAIEHQQAGQLLEAEKICRQILADHPGDDRAMHLLGLLASQGGRDAEAIDLISAAIVANDKVAAYHCNLGAVLQRAARLDDAIAACRRAVAIDPNFPEAYCNLGNAFQRRGDLTEAIAAYRRALEIRPGFAHAQSHLDKALAASNQGGSAPLSAETCNEQGIALARQGRVDDAIAAFRRAIAIDPRLAGAHNNLGNALSEANRPDEALESFQDALSLSPHFGEAYNGMGMALVQTGRPDSAIPLFRQAIRLIPDAAEIHNNLGNALRANAQAHDAIAAYDQAIRLRPDFEGARFNRALALSLLGDYEHVWPEFELRSTAQPRFLFMQRGFPQMQWDGSALEGRTIFLHAEQGFGDTLQLLRYIPLVAQRGGRIVLGLQSELVCLVSGIEGTEGIEQIVTPDQAPPQFDVHCPLASLPLAFGTRLDSIPSQVPYLKAQWNGIENWRRRLGPHDGRLRIGVAWAGNAKFRADRTRSIHLSQFAPLGEVKEVVFYSLQKGPAALQTATPPAGMNLVDLGPQIEDFADTAAVMTLLDLVISTDTSVAHLAGALGRPVWVMLQYSPDWRWLLQREDSPWYPTMRLYRQKALGNWANVVENVAAALRKQVSDGNVHRS